MRARIHWSPCVMPSLGHIESESEMEAEFPGMLLENVFHLTAIVKIIPHAGFDIYAHVWGYLILTA